jgi:hypothetical protein
MLSRWVGVFTYAVNVKEQLQQAAVAAGALPSAAGWLFTAGGFKWVQVRCSPIVVACLPTVNLRLWLLSSCLRTRVRQLQELYQQQQADGYAQQVGGTVCTAKHML